MLLKYPFAIGLHALCIVGHQFLTVLASLLNLLSQFTECVFVSRGWVQMNKGYLNALNLIFLSVIEWKLYAYLEKS